MEEAIAAKQFFHPPVLFRHKCARTKAHQGSNNHLQTLVMETVVRLYFVFMKYLSLNVMYKVKILMRVDLQSRMRYWYKVQVRVAVVSTLVLTLSSRKL